MRVVGLCRFSYPAEGGFKREHETTAQREAYLYAPERMENRFRHFEALTLPSILAQDDTDFTFVVVTGENMPKIYWEHLNDICSAPQIEVVTFPPMRHRPAMQAVIQGILGDNDQDNLQFRLDDDDAVAKRFVGSLRWTAKHLDKMSGNWRRMAIEYSHGYSVHLSDKGIEAQETVSEFWACGLAVRFRAGDDMTIMNYPHHKLHHKMPTFVNPLAPMFLRAVHDDNDSNAWKSAKQIKPIDAKIRRQLENDFNVREDHVRQLFARPELTRATA